MTILRKGESIKTVNTEETDEKQLTELMVGHPVSLEIERPQMENCEVVMEIKDLVVKQPDGAPALNHVTFDLKRGEILGT